ncbi:tyrosine-type recombinase/integrase [Actinomadura rupiterrae]|uniref:tyrosine-type recombinase/integrase n=1 Tax=Actinomadura rupiterrae TaxID=559627 RepID=UPI0020A255A3|nr:site-specific integrase [Actinomadura rupiterrae]MCP2337911.1 integrase [Actinomadura rupiterrae]
MRGVVFKRCGCRNSKTGKPYSEGKCPQLEKKGHGAWWGRYDAPRSADGKRRQPRVGPFDRKKDAESALAEEVATVESHGQEIDRRLKVALYLTEVWLPEKKKTLSKVSYDDYREIVTLYLLPGLGHLRLVGVRDKHASDLYRAILQINRPLADGEKPSDLLLRLLEARAPSAKKPGEGETARRKQTKPISPSRVKKIHAVLQSAMNWAEKSKRLKHNPIKHVEPPRIKGRKVKPLVWTSERIERWLETGKAPGPVMVWSPAHTGTFLDFAIAAEERMYALFHVVAFRGLRRAESAGLARDDADLTRAGSVTIRETLPNDVDEYDDGYDDTKTPAGERTVALDKATCEVLLDWQKQQGRERLAAGSAWVDSGRFFTQPDGRALRPQWISTRFETLIRKYATYRRRYYDEGWSVEQIARRHRIHEQAVRIAIEGGPLPPIRFHDLRHGAATLALAANVNMKAISETLGHARFSFTADTYGAVLPEILTGAAEAAAAVVPRRSASEPEPAPPSEPSRESNVISLETRRRGRVGHTG